MVLQEHWLWPFELDQLGSIDPNFDIPLCVIMVSRHPQQSHRIAEAARCSILWQKSICAVSISNLDSDRICGIQLPIKGLQLLIIIGVYMPSSEYSQETYNNYISAVNRSISTVPPSSHLLLVGDLNCQLGGPRSSSDPDQTGMQ